MTRRRRQVLDAYTEAAARGEAVPTMARIARSIGVYDYRDVRRIRRDLVLLGHAV